MQILLVCLASTALLSIPAYGAETVKIGVLASGSKARTVVQWQPLAVTLKRSLPDRSFVVVAMTSSEMDLAVANRQLDFLLTNPGHYVLLAARSGLPAPLATLAADQNGRRTSVFGGAIFTRSEQTGIETLGDMKGKTIAVVDTESLDGYQIQARELARAGLQLPQDAKLTITGLPHDRVVDAVLAGADVGFVRAGVLEDLARQGRLDMKQIRVLNRQNLPGFPVEVSTPLYPEWPFGALPHVDEKLARHVAAALFLLQENTATTRAMGIRGFSLPADYTAVADLLSDLHIPPFDAAPHSAPHDRWTDYEAQIIAWFLAIGLILLLSLRLRTMKRRLATERQITFRKNRPVTNAGAKLLARFDATTPDLLFELGLDGRYHACDSPYIDFLCIPSADLIGQSVSDVMPPDAAGVVMASLIEANEHGESHGKQLSLALPHGNKCFELSVVRKARLPNEEPDFMVLLRDVTERKKAEDK
ncbi:MAG TPA: PhnD/SsuA/transferrin family substrate-binding protein, partial [Pseudomonas sp.]|nr:PhnD/SsuA/transferrin family substrate-binding protein [Pseudomonas sp.]